ncbi:hypothetical protein DB346_14930 [Verrucomicrobia bacterium LW23]|nr:hypothetical protein DB346_14930 [Verrucomicrobia bacterium LW23]
MKSDSLYIRALLAVVGVAAVLGFLFGRPGNPDRDLWLPSTFNPEQRGTKAVYTTLQEMGWPVERWRTTYSELPNTGTGNVMVFSRSGYGQREPFVASELDYLFQWIKAGNHFVALGPLTRYDDGRSILRRSGYGVPPGYKPRQEGIFERGALLLQPDKRNTMEAFAPPGSTYSGVIQPVLLEVGELFHGPPAAPKGTLLLTSSSGEVVAVRLAVGLGTITFVSSPSLIDNGLVGAADNLRLFLDLLRPVAPTSANELPAVTGTAAVGPMPPNIWFEEGHHGYRITYKATEVLNLPGLRMAGLQILVGILIFITSQMVRFGLIMPLPREQMRATMEFVSSMAKLYRRADLRDEVMRALYDDTHQRVLKKLNLPPTTSHDEISRLMSDAFPHLPRWKRVALQFDNKGVYVEGLPPSGWMKMARELVSIKNAMI